MSASSVLITAGHDQYVCIVAGAMCNFADQQRRTYYNDVVGVIPIPFHVTNGKSTPDSIHLFTASAVGKWDTAMSFVNKAICSVFVSVMPFASSQPLVLPLIVTAWSQIPAMCCEIPIFIFL